MADDERQPAGQAPYPYPPGGGPPQPEHPPHQPGTWPPPAYGPYGPPGYGAPGFGPPGQPPRGPNTSAVTALVLNCFSVLLVLVCLVGFVVTMIPGIITGIMAVNLARTNPALARRLTIWSWVCLVVGAVLSIVVVVVGFLAAGS